MDSFTADRSMERFEARRVVGWEQRDGGVVLQVEGVLANGAEKAGSVAATAASRDQIEVALAVLESGALRLTIGLVEAPGQRDLGLLGEPELVLAPLATTTTD